MIAFPCPGCGGTLPVEDVRTVRVKACPRCRQPLTAVSTASNARASWDETRGEDVHGLRLGGPPSLPFLGPAQAPGEIGRLGGYGVVRVLGSGGMGVVLEGVDLVLRRAVALKVVRPELYAQPALRARFLREAQATAALDHPHVVPIYQVGEDGDVAFIAMPLLKGEPLDVRLHREKRLSVAQSVRLARQTAQGLAAAHQRGLIHRDVKPANLWLEPHDGERGGPDWIKILDFGLARSTTDDLNLTAAGAVLGTPAYMSPEQASGKTVDARTDLFSLGAVLYEMLSGVRAFTGVDTFATLCAVTTDTPRSIAELNPLVPAALADLTARLLAKNPADRPASARAVADELAALEGEPNVSLVVAAPRRPARLLLPLTVGGVGLAALAGAVYFLLPPSPREAPIPATVAEPTAVPTDKELVAEKPVRYWTNSIGMKLAPIPKGKVVLGRGGEPHEIDVPQPFHIGAYEVTLGQFRLFAEAAKYTTDAERLGGTMPLGSKEEHDPAVNWRNPGFAKPQTDDHPVVCVSWNDAVAFCKWLSKKEGRDYGLPTEAEAEFAARCGPHSQQSETEKLANSWLKANSDGRTHPVGRLKPNAWGLYDMYGNAIEWVADNKEKELKDPRWTRMARGGSWASELHGIYGGIANTRRTFTGFRVVLHGGVE